MKRWQDAFSATFQRVTEMGYDDKELSSCRNVELTACPDPKNPGKTKICPKHDTDCVCNEDRRKRRLQEEEEEEGRGSVSLTVDTAEFPTDCESLAWAVKERIFFSKG